MATHEDELARIIWHTSRADESSISATGANIVAHAVLASDWFAGVLAVAWDRGASFVASSPTGLDRKTWDNPYREVVS